MFRWWKERKNKKRALRYIQESNAEIERVFRELTAIAIEAALMAKANASKRTEEK